MKKTAIVSIISLAILITPVVVSAAYLGIVPCKDNCTICDLFVGVSRIIDFLLKNIAFPLGVVAILWGGFMIMTSGGSEERVKKGKTALEFAVYGIIFAFAGWLIVGTILSNLVSNESGFVWPFQKKWNNIPSCPINK